MCIKIKWIFQNITPILYNLHGKYLEKVNKNREYRTSRVIQRYLYSLDTALVYYLLNQEKQPVQTSKVVENESDIINKINPLVLFHPPSFYVTLPYLQYIQRLNNFLCLCL